MNKYRIFATETKQKSSEIGRIVQKHSLHNGE